MKVITDQEWATIVKGLRHLQQKVDAKHEELEEISFYREEIDDIIRTVEAYPITMEMARKLVRVAAIIDAERSPGYTYKHLVNHYKEYHGWTGEL